MVQLRAGGRKNVCVIQRFDSDMKKLMTLVAEWKTRQRSVREIRLAGGGVMFFDWRPRFLSRLLDRFGLGLVSDVSFRYVRGVDEHVWQSVGRLGCVRVVAARGSSLSDKDMYHLRGLTNIVLADFGETGITDVSLEHIQRWPRLLSLYLDRTRVSDIGLASLSQISTLEMLCLEGTGVGDRGLAHLENLSNLKSLRLRQSAVTTGGVERMRLSVRSCTVDWA
jgi:hypothetical protein